MEARVKASQKKFITDILTRREGMKDDPLMLVWSICRDANTRGYRYLKSVIDNDDPIQSDIARRRLEVSTSEKTKSKTYVSINPELSVWPAYNRSVIPEYQRVSVTRFRVSSHNLAIETGRWTRTPREKRLCLCGTVQTEEHVVCFCPRTAELRAKYPLNYTSVAAVVNDDDITAVASFIPKCINLFV